MRIGITLDACMANDARHRAEMEHAGATMLSVLRGEMPAPRGLCWSREAGGTGDRKLYIAMPSRAAERDRLAEMQRSGGDACARCGARPGACNHAPVFGGRLVCL